MRSYLIFGTHIGSEQPQDIVAVHDGFSWSATLFSPFWFLWRGMWVHSIVAVLYFISLAGLMTVANLAPYLVTVAIVSCIWVGFEARFLHIEFLNRQGFDLKQYVSADNSSIAENTFIGSHAPLEVLKVEKSTNLAQQESTDMIFSKNWDS